MADLRKLIADLGYDNVRSLLNSGNVVFTGPAKPHDTVAAEIEDALVLKLGVASRTIVLGCDDLDAIISSNPLLDVATDHARLLTFILGGVHSRAAIEALSGQDWRPAAMAVGERAAYVWCPDGILDSPVVAAVGKRLGDATTTRNWATLSKLHALCQELPA